MSAGESNRGVEGEKATPLELPETAYRYREQARRIVRMLGPTAGAECLLVGGGRLILALQAHGGRWTYADDDAERLERVRRAGVREVAEVRGGRISLADGRFERVVVVDFLEHIEDDYGFVAECHRLLKQEGRLVVHAAEVRRWSLLNLLEKLFGVVEPGRVREGYNESLIFDLLKDGFDLEEFIEYERFFSGMAGLVVGLVAEYIAARKLADGVVAARIEEGLKRFFAVSYYLEWTAAVFDRFLFFTHGRRLTCRARRRIWRPRRTPVLHDGRSIAEAALKTKIGTAAPF